MSPKDLHDTVTDREMPASMAENEEGAYWRHAREYFGEVVSDPEKHREFDTEHPELLDPASRRNFMKVMGASMMLAGLTSCARQPEEKIVPYVKSPEESIPGRFDYYATAVSLAGYGMGVVATSYSGRPTKIEGLAEHPASQGATGIHAQASVLDLYSPDRLESISRAGTMATWNQFVADMARSMADIEAAQGEGLTILTETVTSPTIQGQMAQLAARFPKMAWREHDPMGRNNARLGAMQAFGRYAETKIDFLKAKAVLSLDADFLHEGPAHVRYARDFAVTRSADARADAPDYIAREHFAHDEMSRLYVAECSPTLTGAAADHLMPLRYTKVETLARVVAERVGVSGVSADSAAASQLDRAWVDALIEDLTHHRGHAVVVPGDAQPPVVHTLAHAINAALGAVESGLVTYIDSPEADATDQEGSLGQLVDDLNNDRVKLLVILGGNPVYNTPGDVDFAAALDRAPLRVHLAAEKNETSERCHWVIPEAHSLESWGDIRAYDGTHSIIQPLIRPLYNSKAASQILAVLLDNNATASDYDLVRERFAALYGADSETKWKKALSLGYVEGSAFSPVALTARAEFPAEAPRVEQPGLELVFRLDPHVGDGRHANNGWLQELPKPLTRLTWDNALHIHPTTAKLRDLEHEDVVVIKVGDREVRAAVMLMFGHPQNVATLHLGHGRQVAGHIGKGRGFNAYTIRSAASPWHLGEGVIVAKTGRTYMLARTEEHSNIEKSLQTQAQKAKDRYLIRDANLDRYKADPAFVQRMGHPAPERENTLYKPEDHDYAGLSWGMTIDLNRCTGCSVCVIACQAENNIPIVGKQDVKNGREMHWIRVDRYYKGDMYNDVRAAHQPVPCMQCENAPCEPVCPVGATMHSVEGLNDMVYNRCVGTRYCANNCPYKVRRFNFFHYQIREGQDAPQLKMMRNPNVTVRSRGVMEKCTYCVQRINAARIDAKVAAAQTGGETNIPDGSLVTACQAACPSRAIDFGNINDPASRVALRKQNPRDYGLLADIGTRPRTTYLAKLHNPSPNLGGDSHAEATPEH